MFFTNFLIFSTIFYQVYTLNIVNKSQTITQTDCINLEFPINTETDSNKFLIELLLENNQLKIIPKIESTETTLRLINKQTKQLICTKSNDPHLFELTDHDYGSEFFVEIQIKQEIRFILFTLPKRYDLNNLKQQEIFCYIDITDQNVIKLFLQQLPNYYNVENYKVEVWRIKNNQTTLQDLRLISGDGNKTISFDYFTYYEEGDYFFKISVISADCPEDYCLKTITPYVYIERKSMSLVIGIVGASFILPFVLFIFHKLTKKYSFEQQSSLLDTNRKILIIYQQSTKLHNNVVLTFGKYLEDTFNIDILYDTIPKSKCLKQPEKLCEDTLLLTNDIIYIAPPIYEDIQQLDFIVNNKRLVNVSFDYTTRKLPEILQHFNCFKLLDDIEQFFNDFCIDYDYDYNQQQCYYDLIKQIQLANNETQKILNSDLVPMIIVTDST